MRQASSLRFRSFNPQVSVTKSSQVGHPAIRDPDAVLVCNGLGARVMTWAPLLTALRSAEPSWAKRRCRGGESLMGPLRNRGFAQWQIATRKYGIVPARIVIQAEVERLQK